MEDQKRNKIVRLLKISVIKEFIIEKEKARQKKCNGRFYSNDEIAEIEKKSFDKGVHVGQGA